MLDTICVSSTLEKRSNRVSEKSHQRTIKWQLNFLNLKTWCGIILTKKAHLQIFSLKNKWELSFSSLVNNFSERSMIFPILRESLMWLTGWFGDLLAYTVRASYVPIAWAVGCCCFFFVLAFGFVFLPHVGLFQIFCWYAICSIYFFNIQSQVNTLRHYMFIWCFKISVVAFVVSFAAAFFSLL